MERVGGVQVGTHVEYCFSAESHMLISAARTCINTEIARVLTQCAVTHTSSRIPTQYTVNYDYDGGTLDKPPASPRASN
jgi:hypothetical protein